MKFDKILKNLLGAFEEDKKKKKRKKQGMQSKF